MSVKSFGGIFKERVVRVFISSTFSDMKEEREQLVKHVFPQLRKLCDQRGVTWGEVDLRWGITDEQSREGKVLPICLEEIRSCRPFFIGILGERYGFIPKKIRESLIEQEPWLMEHLEKSVTELEILHGVLNDPEMAEHAYFYFRDPSFSKTLPNEDKTSRDKLTALKDKIRKSGLPVHENYPDPKTFAELVFKDISDVIEQCFPKGSELDPLDREALDHEALAQNKSRVYIGRKEYFGKLDKHVESKSEPLVVLGESGAGKTALIANWIMHFREENPDEFVIMHFVGGTQQSSDWALMLRRIMNEFKRRFNIDRDIPTEPDKLRSDFANWLHMAAAKGRVILLIDALNQLEDKEGALDLVWLPPVIPENIRLILTTLPGGSLDDLEKREWPQFEVKPLDDDERKLFVHDFLAQYRKKLDDNRVARIVSSDQTRNPLYLNSLLNELRVFGEHTQLDERIDYYLQAENVPQLFDKILERFEQDYEHEKPDLVRDAMSFIWASRRGISESELLEILGEDNNPLPQAFWSPFYLAAERYLVSRSGLTGFSHAYMRQAVRNRYLKDVDKQKSAHIQLADYFERQEINTRKVDELPWQLSSTKEWKRLFETLSNFDFFDKAWHLHKFEILRYWTKIQSNSELNLMDAFKPLLKSPLQNLNQSVLISISQLLSSSGYFTEANALLSKLIEFYREVDDQLSLVECMNLYSSNLIESSCELDKAMNLLNEQERICLKHNYSEMLKICKGNKARILFLRGEIEESESLHKEVEQICRKTNDLRTLAVSLSNQAVILKTKGRLDDAMKILKEEETICRQIGDIVLHLFCIGSQAYIFHLQGKLEEALELLKEQEKLSRDIHNQKGLIASICGQAAITADMGDLETAIELFKEQEKICTEINDQEGLLAALGNQGHVLLMMDELNGAIKLLKKQESICLEIENFNGYWRCLGNQASVHLKLGDAERSMSLRKKQEKLCREANVADGISLSLAGQAEVLLIRKEPQKALPLVEEAFNIANKNGFKQLCEEINPLLEDVRSQTSKNL